MSRALQISPGDKFKELEVIQYEPNKKSSSGARCYICKCVCGKILTVSTTDLKSKIQYLSCSHNNYNNLLGKKFGNIEIINLLKRADKRGKGGGDIIWEYRCLICNKVKSSRSDSILSGSVVSCGKLKCKPKIVDKSVYYTKHKHTDWKLIILNKYNNMCNICHSKDSLEAHHLNAKSSFPEQRYDINNGVCLCHSCHMDFHRMYGSGKNTISDFMEYKNDANN